jgi:hypothetical protein
MRARTTRNTRNTKGVRKLGAAVLVTVALAACSSSLGDGAQHGTTANGPAANDAPGATNGSSPTNQPGATNGSDGTNGQGPLQVDADGVSDFPPGAVQSQLDALPVANLTPDEIDGLLWMREEEKLALDVYTALYDRWNARVFSNIAAAEQTHTDSVKTLLDRYGLTDPAADTATGVFTDPTIQGLYDDLVAQGSVSLEAALTVGATIEDLDIADLQARATTTPDIALVYGNLEKGSRNHMRAFSTQLSNLGVTYTPAYITQDAYDAIVSSAIERGPGG